MWGHLCGAICVAQCVVVKLVLRDQSGSVYVARSMQFNRCGAAYGFQCTLCSLCDAVEVAHSMCCNIRGAIYGAWLKWGNMRGARFAAQPTRCKCVFSQWLSAPLLAQSPPPRPPAT
eukprot:655905-Pyramimonas_sp.AAC.1